MSENGRGRAEQFQRPRPRIQSLSDLIFGLALSIGALNLIASKPPDTAALLGNIASFGFSFLVLILVWFRYTEIMSVLPVETTRTRALNTIMLFLVAIEPYLFNQLSFGLNTVAFSTLSQNDASAVYALDIGAIWAILASFSHILSSEERNLVAPDLLRKYRLFRNLELIVGGLFFVSILPPFWTYAIGGTNLRYVLWLLSFFVRRGGNLYSRAALKQRH
ncbi:MAG: hypothetical protein AUI50_02120 [Crenarchaeota archaeon 13_1_40CM_2_52_14]|nr:MAG: hypothetical protein AUI50_02120 [Crenarchaeota archaeon 13_1_40CM_2_52_14]